MKNTILLLVLLALSVSCKKNTPPMAVITINPSNGNTETEFLFNAGGSQDAQTANDMLKFRWDWESDGQWDTDYSTVQSATHRFSQAGMYNIKLEVMDGDGLTDQTTLGLIVSEANQQPVAKISVTPDTGNITTVYTFDASQSTDAETPTGELLVHWDWENKGDWTGYTTTKTATHQFSIAGTYTVKLEVKDGGGLTGSETKTVTVTESGPETGSFADDRETTLRTYKWVKIGSQTWMAENLAWLPSVSPSSTGYDTSPYYYVNGYEGSIVSEAKSSANYATYGVLYNWVASNTACPAGWHLPGEDEWKILEKYLGMNQSDADNINFRESGSVGKKLKSTSGWYNNGHGDNSSGFNAVPGGARFNSGAGSISNNAYFWSASGLLNYNWSRALDSGNDGVYRYYYIPDNGFSVRCLKDM